VGIRGNDIGANDAGSDIGANDAGSDIGANDAGSNSSSDHAGSNSGANDAVAYECTHERPYDTRPNERPQLVLRHRVRALA